MENSIQTPTDIEAQIESKKEQLKNIKSKKEIQQELLELEEIAREKEYKNKPTGEERAKAAAERAKEAEELVNRILKTDNLELKTQYLETELTGESKVDYSLISLDDAKLIRLKATLSHAEKAKTEIKYPLYCPNSWLVDFEQIKSIVDAEYKDLIKEHSKTGECEYRILQAAIFIHIILYTGLDDGIALNFSIEDIAAGNYTNIDGSVFTFPKKLKFNKKALDLLPNATGKIFDRVELPLITTYIKKVYNTHKEKVSLAENTLNYTIIKRAFARRMYYDNVKLSLKDKAIYNKVKNDNVKLFDFEKKQRRKSLNTVTKYLGYSINTSTKKLLGLEVSKENNVKPTAKENQLKKKAIKKFSPICSEFENMLNTSHLKGFSQNFYTAYDADLDALILKSLEESTTAITEYRTHLDLLYHLMSNYIGLKYNDIKKITIEEFDAGVANIVLPNKSTISVKIPDWKIKKLNGRKTGLVFANNDTSLKPFTVERINRHLSKTVKEGLTTLELRSLIIKRAFYNECRMGFTDVVAWKTGSKISRISIFDTLVNKAIFSLKCSMEDYYAESLNKYVGLPNLKLKF